MRTSRAGCALARIGLDWVPDIAGGNLPNGGLAPGCGHRGFARVAHAPLVDVDGKREARDECALTNGRVARLIVRLLHALNEMITHPARHLVAVSGIREIEEAERVRLTGGVSPEKQIQLALFLASDRASYVTGAIVPMDGGAGAVF